MVNPFVQRVLDEFFYLLRAPLIQPELWWIITPLIAVLVILTFYFGKYIKEKLGWNTALGNSIVLLFVGIDLLRTLYHYSIPPSWWQLIEHPITTLIIIAVMVEGILLSVFAFRHAIPKKVMFFIASPLPVNLQAYVLTVIVYTQAQPTFYTLLAAILLFIVLYVFLRIIQEIQHLAYRYHFKNKKKKRK